MRNKRCILLNLQTNTTKQYLYEMPNPVQPPVPPSDGEEKDSFCERVINDPEVPVRKFTVDPPTIKEE